MAPDEGIEFGEESARRAEWNTLAALGGMAFRVWESRLPGNHAVHAPEVTELAGGPQVNPMTVRKLPSGTVVMTSMYSPFAPALAILRAPELPGGLAYALNDKILTRDSPLQDLQLATRLSGALLSG